MRAASLLLSAAAVAAGFLAFSFAGHVRGEDSAPAGPAAAGPQDVMTMDVDFLREKLLKLWVIEEASDRHNQRRIAEKSFRGMTPLDPTGDPELDRTNREEYLKNDKHLRHYLLLEMDNAIEAIDICKHVLGFALKPPHDDRALKAFLEQELPAIAWRNVKIDAALDDLGRKIGTPVEFSGVGPNEDVRIDLQLDPGFQLQQALELIFNIHPIEWRYEGGKLIVRYMGTAEPPK